MSCTASDCNNHNSGLSLASSIKGYLSAWLRRVRCWQRNTHGRQELAQLDDRMLRDIGLSRHDAQQIIQQPFWKD